MKLFNYIFIFKHVGDELYILDPGIEPNKYKEEAIKITAVRELFEETGLVYNDKKDTFRILNPLAYSSPGLTDESNAIALFVLDNPDLSVLSSQNTTGSELMESFYLLNKSEALECFSSGRDPRGNFFSIYTWCFLMYFISDMWR